MSMICDHMCSFTPSVYYCWLWINCCHFFWPMSITLLPIYSLSIYTVLLATRILQLSPFHQCPTIIGWLDNLFQNSHPTRQYLSISGVYSIFPSFSTHVRRPASDICGRSPSQGPRMLSSVHVLVPMSFATTAWQHPKPCAVPSVGAWAMPERNCLGEAANHGQSYCVQ